MGLLAPLTQRRNPLLWQADIPAQYLEGLDPTFRQRLETMQDAMPPELRQDLGAISGYRSVEHQQRLWDDALERYGSPEAARQWVAPPGRSNHNHGNAVDLSYQSDAAREWVHENAGEFGLNFPMSWENWHIEPLGDDGGRVTGGAVASAAGRPASAPLGGSNMGAGGAQQERAPFGQRLRDGFRDGSMWDALAIGLNGMTLRPDPGLQGMVGERMQERREDGRLNQTVEWLRSIGRDDLAAAVQSGGLSRDAAGGIAFAPTPDNTPSDIRSLQMRAEMLGLVPGTEEYNAFIRANGRSGNGTPPRVQSSEILEDGTVVSVMSDGTVSVTGPDGQVLSGEAAAAAVQAARDYAVDNQQAIYGARTTGRLESEIELGGSAAQVEELGQQTALAAVSALQARTAIEGSISNINEALEALESGADSGAIYRILPRFDEAGASLQNAMDRMGLDVVGMVTFGALSENEMRLAMETAVPRNLGPQELRAWLERRRDAQISAARTLEDAAIYLSTPGNTINGWLQRNRQDGSGQEGGGQEDSSPPDGWLALDPDVQQVLRSTYDEETLRRWYGDFE